MDSWQRPKKWWRHNHSHKTSTSTAQPNLHGKTSCPQAEPAHTCCEVGYSESIPGELRAQNPSWCQKQGIPPQWYINWPQEMSEKRWCAGKNRTLDYDSLYVSPPLPWRFTNRLQWCDHAKNNPLFNQTHQSTMHLLLSYSALCYMRASTEFCVGCLR